MTSNQLSIAAMIFCLFLGFCLGLYLTLQFAEKSWTRQQQRVIGAWQAELSNLFVFLNPAHLFLFHMLVSFIVPALFAYATGRYFLSVVLAITCAIAPKHLLKFVKNRRLQQFDDQLADSLMQIAGALKAGTSLVNAIELLSENSKGPVAQEFGLVVQEYRMGTTLEQALKNIEQRVPSENLALAVTTATIAQETGGNLAESFERLADSVRQKLMIEKKIKSLTSQGKLQGIVVGLLPIGIGIVLAKIEPEAMQMIFTTWLGYITIVIIILLETMGLYCIKKIVAIEV